MTIDVFLRVTILSKGRTIKIQIFIFVSKGSGSVSNFGIFTGGGRRRFNFNPLLGS